MRLVTRREKSPWRCSAVGTVQSWVWGCVRGGLRGDHPEEFVAAIEDFGQDDGAIEAEAVGVVAIDGAADAGGVAAVAVGVEFFVFEEFEEFAVEGVGAGAEVDGGGAAADAAILGVVGIGDDGDFFDGLEAGSKAGAAGAAGGGDAIDQDFVFAGAAAVDGDGVDVAEGVELVVAPVVAGFGDAGEDVLELEEIAAGGGDVADEFLGDGAAADGRFGLEEGLRR